MLATSLEKEKWVSDDQLNLETTAMEFSETASW